MMITSSLLHRNHLFVTPETSKHNPDVSFWDQGNLSALKCRSMKEFKQAHVQSLKLGHHHDIHSATTLISTCALSAWGCMEYACSIFEQIEKPTSFLFSILIRGYLKDNNPNAAILSYLEMLERDVKPDNFTYPIVLKGCSQLGALEEGMQIHGHVLKLGFHSDIYVQNSLINMYGRCGEIKLSCGVFDRLEVKSSASWSALISVYSSLGLWYDSLRLFRGMTEEHWRPHESTFVSVLSSCAQLGAFRLGRSAHGSLIRHFTGHNVVVETSLIDMYMKCGCLERGCYVFENMPSKSILSYSVMISGLAMHGEGKKAMWVFSDMLREGLKPDEAVYVGLLSACSRAGLVDEGLKAFDKMRFEHGLEPSIKHYGCVVDLMGRTGRLQEAYELVRSMPFEPNDVLWRSLLSACKVHGNLELGVHVQRNLLQLNSNNSGDYILLSDLYAQSLQWDSVAKVRAEMVQRGSPQTPGFSMIEVERKVYKFVSQDKSHPQSDEIYKMLHQMGWQLRFEGYCADISQVPFDVDDEEKLRLLGGHSQKLAIAFGLITNKESPIRIVRNLRMCKDCHTYTKYISKIYDRVIVVRDRNRFHHFREGTCSCRDYW
ncbi:pentatricopeptide repeat-containing protein At1g31920 [Aristolochia californica]|uniref:pentatricopeptide repeat-containing protein At1g31920 n=1 Tax=Aristolochia californica TaxID=171875 RepID=UPI0035E0AF33